MWRQLKNFGINRFVFVPKVPELSNVNIEQYDTMKEALEATKEAGRRVFLEPNGKKTMKDLPARHEDIVLIMGNTFLSNEEFADDNEMYRISGPMKVDMYPTNAAAIALAYWFGQ
jgi:tRNA(Leu) C34 or U34 (ribose-2'-O)-methylase TrmL